MYKMLITGMKKIYSSKHLLCCGSSAYSLWGSWKTWTCSSKGLQELWESEWTLLSIHVLQMGGAPALTIADSFFGISTLMPWVTEKHSCQKHLYHPLLCLYCHLLDPLTRFPLHEDFCSVTFDHQKSSSCFQGTICPCSWLIPLWPQAILLGI